jgi:hypothetical protein
MSFFIVALLLRLRFGVLFSAFSAMFLYFRGSDLANGEGWNGKIGWLLCRSFELVFCFSRMVHGWELARIA